MLAESNMMELTHLCVHPSLKAGETTLGLVVPMSLSRVAVPFGKTSSL